MAEYQTAAEWQFEQSSPAYKRLHWRMIEEVVGKKQADAMHRFMMTHWREYKDHEALFIAAACHAKSNG
jgi:hypothetical protein